MSPLRKRIAYKKKSSFSAGRFILYILLIAGAVYLLFFHRFENKTVYERVTGFFKSEIEKTPDVSISDADREIKKITKSEHKRTNQVSEKEDQKKSDSDKDEIEEVIRKKLEGK
ncbi:MAG: hypothetical protein N3B13_01465 [Deltaproteobacteria bacterium]|nr:hypothetical protein [Deltaproteobacteria bacterium]